MHESEMLGRDVRQVWRMAGSEEWKVWELGSIGEVGLASGGEDE